mmetsp:Transcript_22029/g.48403  ORF Transcript_22029/g.48403 Transcript_22029/m.48403 type:complete len:251 (+) Transcript_22029:2610-3362(+)
MSCQGSAWPPSFEASAAAASQTATASAHSAAKAFNASPSKSAAPNAFAPCGFSDRRRRIAARCFASSSSKTAIRRAASCSASASLATSPSCAKPKAATNSLCASLVTTFEASDTSFSALFMSFSIWTQVAASCSQASDIPSPEMAIAWHLARASACFSESPFRISSSASVRQTSSESLACSALPCFCNAFLRFFICCRCFCSSSSNAAAHRAASASMASCSSWLTSVLRSRSSVPAEAQTLPSGILSRRS